MTQIEHWWNNKPIEKRWILKYSGLLAALLVIYILIHTCNFFDEPKKQNINLTQEQVDFIAGIFTNEKIGSKTQIIRQFLTNSGYSNSSNIDSLLSSANGLPSTELNLYLKSFSFEEDSPFWLTGYFTFIEIVFWSLFGVLSSLLFHGTEAIRKREFKREEQSVHWAKLMYSPIVTIVVILGIEILSQGSDLNLDGLSYSLIVLSFILGFFSRKSIDLLARLKDIIFRPSEKLPINKVTRKAPDFTAFNALPLEKREELLLELIDKNDDDWFERFPNLTGVEIGFKEVENSETDVLCVKFQVDNKSTTINPSRKLPELHFKGYDIPTDVIQSDTTEAMIRASDEITRGGTGTLGLIAQDHNGIEFLVTNYHVIFMPELQTDKYSVEVTSVIANRKVLDSAGNQIATARRGILNKFKDVAIAEISNPPANRSIPGIGIPNGSFSPSINNLNDAIKMNGSISNLRKGKLKGIGVSQTIEYLNKSRKIKIKGLLKIDIVSNPGDSGSAVLNNLDEVIGILVGSDNKASYLIPIEKCLSPYNLSL